MPHILQRAAIAAALALAFVAPAAAQQAQHNDKPNAAGISTGVTGSAPVPNHAAGSYAPVTIGTGDSVILGAGVAFYYLDVISGSPTATICINLGAPATITGSVCAPGEITIPPLWHRSWEGNFVPVDAVHAIASAGATPATVGAD